MRVEPNPAILCKECKYVRKIWSTSKTPLNYDTATCSHSLSKFIDPVTGNMVYGVIKCVLERSQAGHCGPGGMLFMRK